MTCVVASMMASQSRRPSNQEMRLMALDMAVPLPLECGGEPGPSLRRRQRGGDAVHNSPVRDGNAIELNELL